MENLKSWESNGWVRQQPTSAEEIAELLSVVERCFEDCRASVSTDTRFQVAYQAVLTLGTILVRACGYRVERRNHHYRTLQAIACILHENYAQEADYFDDCRKKRNEISYCRVGVATVRDTADLIAIAARLRDHVVDWLSKHHSDLITPEASSR